MDVPSRPRGNVVLSPTPAGQSASGRNGCRSQFPHHHQFEAFKVSRALLDRRHEACGRLGKKHFSDVALSQRFSASYHSMVSYPTSLHMPTRGQHYTRREIAAAHGGSAIEYLPRVDGQVVCACLRTERAYNPDAPRVILPGRGPVIEASAAALIEQRGPIPVYLRRGPNAWEYIGKYEVARYSRSRADIDRYERQTRRPVSCAIFMRRCP